jgi:hypothetical protein
LPAAVRRHVENMRKMSVDGYLGGSQAMHDWRGSFDRLAAITAPTLILVGQEDQLLAPSNAMHQKIAGSRLVVLRHAGHGTNMAPNYRPTRLSPRSMPASPSRLRRRPARRFTKRARLARPSRSPARIPPTIPAQEL